MLLFKTENAEDAELVERNIRRLDDYRNKVRHLEGDVVNDVAPTLRGWEGQASHIYFSTINRPTPPIPTRR